MSGLGVTGSAATGPAKTAAAVPDGRVTRWRVLRAEWTKLRSLRSTAWALLVAVGLMVGIGALLCASKLGDYPDAAAAARDGFAPIPASLNGVPFAQLAVGVLGVLAMTGEHATGTVRATFAVVPRRLPVLWAKLLAVGGVVLVVSLPGALAAFLVGQAVLDRHGLGVGLGAPGAARSVLGAALYLTVVGLIGVALGVLLRRTAAGVGTFVVAFDVVPALLVVVPASVRTHVEPYLPSYAGQAVFRNTGGPEHWLSPWTGLAVLGAYGVVLVALAARRLARADV